MRLRLEGIFFSHFHPFPSSSFVPSPYLHVQEFAAGAGFADVMVEVEADTTPSGQVAGHALEASGLRSEGERARRERAREGTGEGELMLRGSKHDFKGGK